MVQDKIVLVPVLRASWNRGGFLDVFSNARVGHSGLLVMKKHEPVDYYLKF